MADISCIRLVPYRQFKDGTWGSILVVNWLSDSPAVFLFNSEERRKDAPNTARNILLPMEKQQYARYNEAYPEEDAMPITPTKEVYSQYGVARLGGALIGAHIADMVCENLNKHDARNHRNIQRCSNMIQDAKAKGNISVLESELSAYMEDEAAWARDVIEQTLPLLKPGYNHNEWIQSVRSELHTKIYTDNTERGIRAVLKAGICKTKADWGAVFKILTERKLIAKNSYLAGAGIINRVCEQEVTTASAIKQSPALVIIGGTIAKGWTDKAHNRQSANLLLHYKDIAEIFIKG